MSMTKNFYHDEICAQTNLGFLERFLIERRETATGDETLAEASEIFSDYKISPDGYEEFICDLCGKGCDNDFGHSECHDAEKFWADMH